MKIRLTDLAIAFLFWGIAAFFVGGALLIFTPMHPMAIAACALVSGVWVVRLINRSEDKRRKNHADRSEAVLTEDNMRYLARIAERAQNVETAPSKRKLELEQNCWPGSER